MMHSGHVHSRTPLCKGPLAGRRACKLQLTVEHNYYRAPQCSRLLSDNFSLRNACFSELSSTHVAHVACARCVCRATAKNGGQSSGVSVVLLAGGSGKRMGAPIPKQYLELAGQPIAVYSLQVFAGMPEVFEIVIVCNPDYRELFRRFYDQLPRQPKLVFADPGQERQDSVNNGFKAIDRSQAQVVAIHDSARPLITQEDTRTCVQDAMEVGAAVLGVPVKPTIKQVDSQGAVVKTLQRADLWEVQTPQVIQPDLLQAGFELVEKNRLEVTDDVSIIEALGKPVRVTKGSYTNLKVTTPDDMIVAEGFLRERQQTPRTPELQKSSA